MASVQLVMRFRGVRLGLLEIGRDDLRQAGVKRSKEMTAYLEGLLPAGYQFAEEDRKRVGIYLWNLFTSHQSDMLDVDLKQRALPEYSSREPDAGKAKSLAGQLTTARRERDDAENQSQALRVELEELQSQYQALQNVHDTALGELSKELARSAEQRRSLEDENASLKASVDQLNNKLLDEAKAANRAREELNSIKRQQQKPLVGDI